MIRKTIISLLILLVITGCMQLGSLVGGLLTSSTDNLNEVSIIARYQRNLEPAETGSSGTKYIGDKWVDGGNSLSLTFLNRDGIGLKKLEGTITSNGRVVPYMAMGTNGEFTDELEDQNIEIVTKSGMKTSFTLKKQYEIKIKSINNGSNQIDRTKDFIIEFENPKGSENTNIKIDLLMDIAGVTDWAEIGVFKSADKIVIPKLNWKHLPNQDNIAGGIRDGESWIRVERYSMSTETPPNVGAAMLLSIAYDTQKVTVSEEPDDVISRLSIEGNNNGITYDISKPNAYTGRPFSSGKTFALTSFAVRATKLTQVRTSVSSSSYTSGNYKVTTTTTTIKTRKFPTLPKERWDALVVELYTAFEKTLKSKYNINLIDVEKVKADPIYNDLYPIEDKLSTVEYQSTYKGTKTLLPTTLSEILGSASSTFAADRVDARLVRSLGVDGLIAVTVDLEMPWFDEAEEIKLSPRMSFRISSGAVGYQFGPTVYAEGIVVGPGEPFVEENESIPYDFLEKTIQKDKLMQTFGAGLEKLMQEEKSKGYNELWKMKVY